MPRKLDGNWVCGRLFYPAAHAFSAGMKCRHCSKSKLRVVAMSFMTRRLSSNRAFDLYARPSHAFSAGNKCWHCRPIGSLLQVNLDMTDSMGPGKLIRRMQNPSYTYDEYLICIGLGPNMSYSGPSYPSSPVLPSLVYSDNPFSLVPPYEIAYSTTAEYYLVQNQYSLHPVCRILFGSKDNYTWRPVSSFPLSIR